MLLFVLFNCDIVEQSSTVWPDRGRRHYCQASQAVAVAGVESQLDGGCY